MNNKPKKDLVWELFLVRLEGFSAGLRLACASRRAISRLRYPAAKTVHRTVFFTRLQIPLIVCKTRRPQRGLFVLVRLEGFSAGLRLACSPRCASSRLRYPAAKNSPPDCFLHAASNPSECLQNKETPMGSLCFGAAGGI